MKNRINRRTFLRCSAGGAGTLVGLPLLEAMFASDSAYADAPGQNPRFFGFYVPNGIIEEHWYPKAGYNMTGTSAEPFQDAGLKNDISFYQGMNNIGRTGSGNGHMRAIAGFLTGEAIPNDRISTHKISLDQKLADHHKDQGYTGIHSFQTAGNPELDSPLNSNYNNRLKNSLCFNRNGQILNNSANWKGMYDRLFSGIDSGSTQTNLSRRDRLKLSVLDQVAADRQRIEQYLGANDKNRLDQYYSNLRMLEESLREVPPMTGECVAPNVNAPQRGTGRLASIGSDARIAAKIVAVAFQCDLTRVVTYMAGGEAAGCQYADININKHFHNNISHNRAGQYDNWRRIDTFHSELCANFMKEMKDTPHGSGNLLDGTAVIYGSGLGNGDAHSLNDIALMVGGHFGQWQHGKHHKLEGKWNTDLLNTLHRELGLSGSFGHNPGTVPIS